MIETASKYADANDDAEGLMNALVVPQLAKQPKQQAQKRKNTSEEKPNTKMAVVTATFRSGGREGRGGGRGHGRGTSRVQGRGDQQPGKTYSWADIANNPCLHHLDANGGSSVTSQDFPNLVM